MGRLGLALVAVAIVCAGCTDLPPLGTCGNGIVELHEACDGDVGPELACGERGSVAECQYVCDAVRCPAGSGCGADGICRQPTGEVELAGAVVLDGVRLALADLDDDGALDAVAQGGGGIAVRWGEGATSGFTDAGPLLALSFVAPFHLADLDGTDGVDLLAASDVGMVGFLGDPGRALPAHPMASLIAVDTLAARAVPVRFDDILPFESVVLIADGLGMCLLQQCGVSAAVAPLPPGRSAADLIGTIPRADLVGGPRSEFALAFRGDDRVFVYGLEVIGPPGSQLTRPVLLDTVLVTGPISSEPRLVDVVGDGRLDLIVAVGVATNEHVMTAPGQVVGFGPAALDPAFDELVDAGCSSRPWPLVVGRINQDSILDYVGDLAVCHGSSLFTLIPIVFAPMSSPWERAEIGDFDEDGFADVFAASGQRLDVLLQTTDGLYSRRSEVVGGELRAMHLADHDGDGRIDAAVVVRTGGRDRVGVVFGAPDGALTPPVVMAIFPEVFDLASFNLLVSASTLDPSSEIGVLARPAPGSAQMIPSVLIGDGSRRMYSPYFLPDTFTATVAPGRFAGADHPDDALVLGGKGDIDPDRTALAIDNVDGQLTPAAQVSIPVPWNGGDFPALCAYAVPLRVAGPGLESVALVTASGDDPLVNCRLEAGRPPGPQLSVVIPASGVATPAVDVPGGFDGPRSVLGQDVDLDGRDDLLLGFTGDANWPGGLIVARVVDGAVDLAAASLFPGAIHAIAGAVTEATGVVIALRTELGVELVQWTDGVPGERVLVVPMDQPPLATVTALALGDIDRDGLIDIAVLEEGTLRWYLQRAVE